MQRVTKILAGVGILVSIVIVGIFVWLYPGLKPVVQEPVRDVTQELPVYTPPSDSADEVPETDLDLVPVDNGPFILPEGFEVSVYASEMQKPRAIIFDAEGRMLVSDRESGIVWKIFQSENEVRKEQLISGLSVPHGLAFKGSDLYVATRDGVYRYSYNPLQGEVGVQEFLFPLPYDGGHFTRSIQFDKEGDLYVSIGSSCNVCYEDDERLAAVVKYPFEDWDNYEVFASGTRNAVFFVPHPKTGEFWATENGRDWLGDHLPPEEINILRQGGDYGWPVCYGNKVHDSEFDTNTYIRNPCEDTIAPVFTTGAHQAPLGLRFIDSPLFPQEWQGDLLVAYHGSWNSTVPVGYKIVRMDVVGNTITGEEDFMRGFLTEEGVIGRPVDLNFGPDGALYVSDDKSGVIYRISKNKLISYYLILKYEC